MGPNCQRPMFLIFIVHNNKKINPRRGKVSPDWISSAVQMALYLCQRVQQLGFQLFCSNMHCMQLPYSICCWSQLHFNQICTVCTITECLVLLYFRSTKPDYTVNDAMGLSYTRKENDREKLFFLKTVDSIQFVSCHLNTLVQIDFLTHFALWEICGNLNHCWSLVYFHTVKGKQN